jgi:hypothetical protein
MRREQIREAFKKSAIVIVKITCDGFEVCGNPYSALEGRVRKVSLVRKMFEDCFLACSSTDGVYGTEGKSCAGCQHPSCQPRLRLQLASGLVRYLLELNTTSARNFLKIEDQAIQEGCAVSDWTLKLTVASRQYWGEVCFERT